MKRIISLVLAVLIYCICGCNSPQGTRYVEPGEIISGRADKATMYDLESSAQELMEKMLTHPQFAKNYDATKVAKGGQQPVVVIGNIDNRTETRIQRRLDAIGKTIRVALFDSTLFEVKDDEAADAIKSRIIRGADGGLETGELVQQMGTHDMPDFIVLGDFEDFEDVGGYHTYRLRIALHSLRTGKIIWEGIQTKIKL